MLHPELPFRYRIRWECCFVTVVTVVCECCVCVILYCVRFRCFFSFLSFFGCFMHWWCIFSNSHSQFSRSDALLLFNTTKLCLVHLARHFSNKNGRMLCNTYSASRRAKPIAGVESRVCIECEKENETHKIEIEWDRERESVAGVWQWVKCI